MIATKIVPAITTNLCLFYISVTQLLSYQPTRFDEDPVLLTTFIHHDRIPCRICHKHTWAYRSCGIV